MSALTTSRNYALLMILTGLVVAPSVAARPVDFVPVEITGLAIGLHFDVLSTVLLTFVGCVGALVATYSRRNLAGQARTERFGWLLLAALVSLTILVTGASLPIVALGWTAGGLVLAALVAQPGTNRAGRAASFVRRTLLIGDAALWLAVLIAIAFLPTVNRADLTGATLSTGVATAVAALLLVACVVRSAMVPAQAWLPETAEAPSPVSAFLHAGIVNGAGVMVSLFWPLFVAAPAVLLALLVVGAASVAYGTLAARARADVKGQLACSTTAQMGYMGIQLGLGLPAAAVFHLIGHGFYKAWLFLRAGGAVTRERSRPTPRLAPWLMETGSMPPGGRRASATVFTCLTVALVAVPLAWPAVRSSVDHLGPAAVLPAGLALVTALIVVLGGRFRPTGDATGRLASIGVGLASGVAVAAYAWVLIGVERLLSSALPLRALWADWTSTALILGLSVVAVAIAYLVGILQKHPDGALAVVFTRSALAPWTSKLARTRTAQWPLAVRDEVDAPITADQIRMSVELASRMCGPAWPLRTMVAANPVAGLEIMPFDEAATLSTRVHGSSGYLPPSAYSQLYADGRITRDHLAFAIRELDEARDEFRPDSFVASLVDALLAALPADQETTDEHLPRLAETLHRSG